MKLGFDCQRVSRLLSDGQDRHLPTTDRARMRLHMVMCQACRNVDEQLQFLRVALRSLHGPAAAPSDDHAPDRDPP
jgi:predicted anti-sigma-YlaC factor YlaD